MFKKLIMKWLILKMGVASHGLQITMEHGLTSGKTLDYIYQNRPSGDSLMGAFVDKVYLNHPGWKAVRIRRRHLELLLRDSLHSWGHQASVVDIASGPGSYIINVMHNHPGRALCLDLDPRWVEEGNQKTNALGLSSRIHFAHANAFDLPHLKTPSNIIVSSGFYDWIVEDEQVLQSISQVYMQLPPRGIFLLTIQCKHPDQQLVEELFQDFNNAPLKMKMRSHHQVAMWLREQGFYVQKALMDSKGYYCVFKAIKQGT